MVKGVVELDDDRADNSEEAEVEVETSAVYKELITLDETHLDKGKVKLRVSARMAALLTALRPRTSSTGSGEVSTEEDGESNDDDVKEDVMETVIDLAEVAGYLLGVNAATKDNGDDDGDTYENEGGPFVPLS